MEKKLFLILFALWPALFSKDFTAFLTDRDYKTLMEISKLNHIELTNVLKILDQKETIFSQDANREYYSVMPELINKFNLQIGAEIGTLYGGHSKVLLAQTHIKKLYSIDAYKGEHIGMPQSHADVLYYLTKHHLVGYKERSQIIRDSSVVAAKLFKTHELDFIFIDAGHGYEDVKLDLLSWYDKVKPGGIVAGDDYTPSFPGLKRAVNEFFKSKHLPILTAGTNNRFWWVKKP